MSENSTPFYDKVMERARADGLPKDHPLVLAANAFHEASLGYYNAHPTVTPRQFLAKWASVRLLWHSHTGDPLV